MGTCFFHIDLDAFFASVECLDHPEYKGKPLIIGRPGPRSVASTCSYEARKYGVHSAMPMTTALKLCPEAICVDGNYHRYSEKSREVMAIIKAFAPGFLQVSIDEAFVDMTGMERIHPYPGKAARLLKEKILLETGLTVSIGVAPSRFLAKLASDYRKPDGLTIVPAGKEIEFVDAVGLKKLWGIGSSTYETLVRKGFTKPEHLRKYNERELQSLFGEASGTYLYHVSRGLDPGIYQKESKSRSISEEQTYYPDVYGIEVLSQKLLEMADSLMFRAISEEVVPRTITVKLRYGDFTTSTISETPYSTIYSAEDIHRIALRLLESKYNNTGVRLLGLGLGNVYEATEPEQAEFFSEKSEKLRKLEKEILKMSKEGNFVQRAATLKKEDR